MSKAIYIDICLWLKGAGANVAPIDDKLDKFSKEHQLEVARPIWGCEVWLCTMPLTYKSIELAAFYELNEIYLLHEDFVESGGHSIFNQKGLTETNNIIMYMFRIENLKKPNGEIIWENPSHPFSSCHPIVV